MALADVFAPLQQPLFTLLDTPVSWVEVLGFGSGALCVWLVARRHIANWPVGIANNLFFILLFAGAGLYADAALQVVYVALAAYGWWSWAAAGSAAQRLPVTRTGRRTWAVLAPATVIATALLTVLLDRATDSTVPFWDALTTALSLAATYGQCRKKIESWYLWIAADLVYIPLYAYKGLYLTSFLYAGFLLLCLVGLRGWLGEFTARTGTATRAEALA